MIGVEATEFYCWVDATECGYNAAPSLVQALQLRNTSNHLDGLYGDVAVVGSAPGTHMKKIHAARWSWALFLDVVIRTVEAIIDAVAFQRSRRWHWKDFLRRLKWWC